MYYALKSTKIIYIRMCKLSYAYKKIHACVMYGQVPMRLNYSL
jgi:hypothetical protein